MILYSNFYGITDVRKTITVNNITVNNIVLNSKKENTVIITASILNKEHFTIFFKMMLEFLFRLNIIRKQQTGKILNKTFRIIIKELKWGFKKKGGAMMTT